MALFPDPGPDDQRPEVGELDRAGVRRPPAPLKRAGRSEAPERHFVYEVGYRRHAAGAAEPDGERGAGCT
jgi:hypothetical protein